MRTLIFTYFLILLSFLAYSQVDKVETTLSNFVSKTGVIIKIEDFNLSSLKTSYSGLKLKIRSIEAGEERELFFQISKKGKYGSKTASIAYHDLVEIEKAVTILKENSLSDVSAFSDYLENKFATGDGFEVGYFRDKTKLSWYIKLEKQGEDSTAFLNDIEGFEVAMGIAKEKIEIMKR